MVWALKKIKPFLYGKLFAIDHFYHYQNDSKRSWSHFLQALIFRIRVIKDVDNICADFLNRALQIFAVLIDTESE